MNMQHLSEYNRDQLASFKTIEKIFRLLPSAELDLLRVKILPYLEFRQALDQFYLKYFQAICHKSCFESSLSACCGFESIITFFSDHVINFLLSEPEAIDSIFRRLQQPNHSRNCVYLGEKGCIWQVRPVSCAMFFCEQAKSQIFREKPETEEVWADLKKQEKDFTWPIKPVLFDQIEKYFIDRGAESPHLYFHKSPGLLRVKAKARVDSINA